MFHFRISLLLLTTVLFVHAKKDYYWREYDGTIPEDALFGGRDLDGRDAYIGQAYFRSEGLLPLQINTGIKGVYAALPEAKFTKENIKILCGKPDNFAWLQTNSSNVSRDLKHQQPVIGGNEDGDGNYFIGRIYQNNIICIGKVLEVDEESESQLRCVNKFSKLRNVDIYEILVNLNGTETQ